MENEFDKIGKRLPYQVPPNFFDNMPKTTLAEAERRAVAPKSSPGFPVWQLVSVAASLVLLLSFIFIFNRSKDPVLRDVVAVAQESQPTPLSASQLPIDSPKVAQNPHALETVTAEPAVGQGKLAFRSPKDKSGDKKTAVANSSKQPETLEQVLASISEEELLQLASLAEADLSIQDLTNTP